jgi:hypothetical protein
MAVTRARVPNSDKLLAFIFGVVFLSAILVIAIFIPNPSGFSYTVFRIVLALAAAGVGAVIPGFLNVEYRNIVRAGGAIALFVIVYFFPPVPPAPSPPPAVAPDAPPPPVANARSAAEQWLAVLDSGNFPAAYEAMSEAARLRYGRNEMIEAFTRARAHLGPAQSRVFDRSSSLTDPPGSPKGHYQMYGFKTKFANVTMPLYESVQLYGDDGQWKPVGIFVFMKNAAGQMVPYEPAEPAAPAAPAARS